MTESTIASELDELAEEFELLGDWEQQIEYVIQLGRGLPAFPEDARTDANRVSGCVARVWLSTRRTADGRLAFEADSDSHMSKGNIALLLRLFSGRTPREIVDFDIAAGLNKLGLLGILTQQRADGVRAMVHRIRTEAESALAAA